MYEQEVAISDHPVVTRPPRLTDGEILPKAVRNFENHCQNYFVNAKEGVIADDKKVARILSCFDNDLVNDWIAVDRDRLITLTFEHFMTEFRARWLPFDGEREVQLQVLSARFNPKMIRFGAWAYQVQSLNVSLRGTPSHLSEYRMLIQLEANLDRELQSLVWEAKANEIKTLHLWVAKVKYLDDYRHKKRKRIEEAIDKEVRKGASPNTKRRAILPPM